jgi:hypothetical protein
MFDEQRLGNDGTEASRPCKPDDGDNQMKEKDYDLAHPGMEPKPEKHLILTQFSNSPWTRPGNPIRAPPPPVETKNGRVNSGS